MLLLCRKEDLAASGTFNVVLGAGEDELDILIVYEHGLVHAYVNCCPHQFIPLETFPNHFLTEDRRHLICSGHGALFDPATGVCVRGPCAGLSLDRLKIVENDGSIYLDEELPPGEIARRKRASRRW